MNTNGSINNLSAGGDGIIRDHLGNVILAFSSSLTYCNVITAELKGFSYGINMCYSLAIFDIQLEIVPGF